ncbi:MAG: phosphoadenosine phosphosulfate reductase family protein, partial [Cyclobacteriaceae bacterium]
MTFKEIQAKLIEYKKSEKKMFTSSSFQTHSLVMLHIISRIDPSIKVYFLNTGYLFPETVAF